MSKKMSIQKYLEDKPKLKSTLWFCGLWVASLATVLAASYTLKAVFNQIF